MKKVVVISILAFVFIFLFSSCDWGMKIVDISLAKPPNKIIYLKGIDSDLSLDGLEIYVHLSQGQKSIDKWEDEFCRQSYKISHYINFNKPGVYIVTIAKPHIGDCTFSVQVIDPKDF